MVVGRRPAISIDMGSEDPEVLARRASLQVGAGGERGHRRVWVNQDIFLSYFSPFSSESSRVFSPIFGPFFPSLLSFRQSNDIVSELKLRKARRLEKRLTALPKPLLGVLAKDVPPSGDTSDDDGAMF